jgi:hypothetical protein
MTMTLTNFLTKLNQTPEKIEFTNTMAVIDTLYAFTPVRFHNGGFINEVGDNVGSCKLLAFAKLHGFNEVEVLACFGAYYRDDVLKHPNNTDHQNIRHFMQTGWEGVCFEGLALTKK